MSHLEPPRKRRSSAGGAEQAPSPSADQQHVRWELRRTRKPWQSFVEKFGFTLIAIGVAMLVGVLIARMG